MENMEKEGIDFMNISKIDIHMKKKMGAIIGGAVMIVFMLFLIGMFLWGTRFRWHMWKANGQKYGIRGARAT